MKKIIYNVICLLLLLVITGCGLSDEEKQKREEYFAQAKENAVKYIEDKYGFTPEIGTAKCTFDNSDNFASSCNEEIIVNAKYNDKWFEVLIDGSNSTNKGYDNYQLEEISKDILDIISNDFGMPYEYNFYYGYDYHEYEGMIDTYYNGNNLQEIIGTKYFGAILKYVDEDNFEILQTRLENANYSIFNRLYIINYKSLKSYKKNVKETYCFFCSPYSNFDFSEHKEDLKDVIVLYYDGIEYYDFK